jgi:hypothetical protein
MPTIIARHKVSDINAWLKGHQDRVHPFAPAVSSFTTFQDTNDPNSVVLIIEATDITLLAAIINNPKNQVIKDVHTVLDPIIISMPVNPQ